PTVDGNHKPSRGISIWFTAKFYVWPVDAADNCDPDKLKPKSSPLIIRLVIWGLGGSQVNSVSHLPRRLPVGTKYVVESRGEFVHRSIELPDGARIALRKRKSSRL